MSNTLKAINISSRAQKMYKTWTKKGYSEEKRRTLLFAFLDEQKRKHLKEEE